MLPLPRIHRHVTHDAAEALAGVQMQEVHAGLDAQRPHHRERKKVPALLVEAPHGLGLQAEVRIEVVEATDGDGVDAFVV
jgi:hypothetical protein